MFEGKANFLGINTQIHFASGKFKMTMLLGLNNRGGENRRPINLNAMDKTCSCQLGSQGNLYFV